MAEIKEPLQEQKAALSPADSGTEKVSYGGEESAPEQAGVKKPKKPMSKKKKKWIRRIVILVILAVIAAILIKLLGSGGGETSTVITDMVQIGSITSTVEGSGLTKAKNSQSITLTTAGTVLEVYVTEGQKVVAGDPLFVIDSPAAKTAVEQAKSDVESYEKQLKSLQEDLAGLNLSAPYAGKLLETEKLQPDDDITKGMSVAKLVDDTRLRLKQYYSYAYQSEIKAGQSAQVSIPALMMTLTGRVENVYMVDRITPEGSKLFEADIVVDNPGTLTADMTAAATLTAAGETAYPYESGKLEYYRTTTLESSVNGKIISSSLVDYLSVSAGQVLVYINGDDTENDLFDKQNMLTEAKKKLEEEQKNLDNCEALAPIDGTVIGLSLSQGDELSSSATTVITIADTSTITVDATVDERNVSYVQAGMMVDLDQWRTPFTGMVESVSLSSTAENGVATYPMVISVDNFDGTLMTGSYVTYTLVASQSDGCLVLPIQCVKSVPLEDGSTGNVVFIKSGSRPDNAVDLTVPVDDVPEGYWAIPVEIGISDDYNVEIKSGVEEGTEVFTTVQRQSSWG